MHSESVVDDVTTTVAERVAEMLRLEIRSGMHGPGDPLRQNHVAQRLGVSSTPVREAFAILERTGLVERKGHSGVRVFRPSLTDLVENYEIRIALESHATRIATASMGEAGIAHLRRLINAMNGPPATDETFIKLNAEFHQRIADCSGNNKLARLVAQEQAATAAYVTFLGVDDESTLEARREHSLILEAIEAGDSDAAATAMAAHLGTRSHALTVRLNSNAD